MKPRAVPSSSEPVRTSLYTAAELYDTTPYADSLDARTWAGSRPPLTRRATLDQALHDHAIDVALGSWIGRRRLVGVMGGHRLERDQPGYADAARLGAALGSDHVVATGGGPGAMEAANLGARYAGRPDALDDALARLAAVPSFRPSIDAWVGAALDVLDRHPGAHDTLGIPTWHYGHEPSNPFATAIAKYFHNSRREAILLEVCAAGIVFLPGRAGTLQEIFQDACENYYAEEAAIAPMVLVGAAYWTEELPAWPLLQRLAQGTPIADHVHLVDSTIEAAELLVSRT